MAGLHRPQCVRESGAGEDGPEMTHNLLTGQPGEARPALRTLDSQISADIAVYLTKLPAN
jgi:hypothetical protein